MNLRNVGILPQNYTASQPRNRLKYKRIYILFIGTDTQRVECVQRGRLGMRCHCGEKIAAGKFSNYWQFRGVFVLNLILKLHNIMKTENVAYLNCRENLILVCL